MAATLSDPCSCCVMPIDHTRMAVVAAAYMRAKRSMSARDAPDWRSRSVKDSRSRLLQHLVEAFGVLAHELTVDPTVGQQHLHHAVEERDVATRVDPEELVGHLRSEHRALDVARHPVAIESGLAHRVDDRDLGAALARQVQVLHEHRLRVGDVGAEEHDQVALDDVGVRARRRANADRALQHGGRRCMTDPRRVVDVVGAEEARDLLRDVVRLVRDAARGEVDGQPLRSARTDAIGDEPEGLVPRDAGEATVAFAAHHRVGEPAEITELLAARATEARRHRRVPQDRARPSC